MTNKSSMCASLVFLAAFVLTSHMAAAQGLTGALVGTVKDEQGGVLPGALVRVTSPALLGGELTTTTNERGQLRVTALPPGSYALDIEMPGKFAPYHEEDIRIGAGATIERNAVLSLGGVTESIVVQGAGSRIEARGSGFETRFGQEDLQTIPTRRFSMFDLVRAAPGVSPTAPSSGANNTMSAFGSGTNENLFLIDGTNFTCPCSGNAVAEPGVDVIQEVQVQMVGASAEFGNIQGAVFNVVTRQGSNRFQYDASYYGQASTLTSQPVVRPVTRGSQPTSGYERQRYRDFTTNLGGPVVRDRVWFFGGYQYLRDYDSQPGTDPLFPRTYEQDKVFAKLTWQLKPGMQVLHSFHDEFWVNPTPPTIATPFEATTRLHASVPAITFGHLTHTLSNNTVWDVRVGRFVLSRQDDPATGNATIASRFDRITGISSGNPQPIGGLTLIRTTGKATLTRFEPGLAGADHEWRIGTQVERGLHRRPEVIPTGTRFIDNNGAPFQAVSRTPATHGGQFDSVAAFASDSLNLGSKVTINAGVRFDYNRAISQDLLAPDVSANETDQVIEGLGTLYTWRTFSPRLGVTAKLSADGRTMLRSSYGRFRQGILTGEFSLFHPGVTPTTTMAFDAATGGYTTLVSVVDSRINLLLDSDLRGPHTDEFSIGIDRELSPRLAVAAAYIRKDGRDFIAWKDVGGRYREESRTLSDGRSIPVFVLTNSTAASRFLLTNPDGYSLAYNGLVLAAEKRRSNGWHAFGSYTFSRTYGLQVSSAAAAGGPQVSTIAPSETFGRDPNNLTNARGRLPNDRPHVLRVMGSVEVPRTGVSLAANLQQFSGKPWAASAQVSLPQGDQRILLETRGSRRLSSQSLLDMRVSRPFAWNGVRRVELLLDVLNLLNDTAEEGLATDNLYSPNFGQPSLFMDPRRAMLSVRLNLGN